MKAQNVLHTPGLNQTPDPIEERRHSRSLIRGRALISLGVVLLAVFGGITALVLLVQPQVFDVPITRAIQEADFPPFNWLMLAASWPGFSPQNFIWPVAVILVVALLFKRLVEAAFLALATVLDGATDLVKLAVHRGRPSADLVHVIGHPNTYSFPSGHVTQYVLFFGFSFYLAFTLLKHGAPRTLLLAFCALLVILVGPSRIWMGQHWASDVLGGYTLGTGLLLFVIWGYRGWEARRTGQAAK